MSARPEGLGRVATMVRLADSSELQEHLGRLAGPLGLDEADVEHLSTLDCDDLALHLRARLDELRGEQRAQRAAQAEADANAAADELARTAHWNGSTVYLDPVLILGGLSRHPNAKLIGFDLDDQTIYVSTKKLRQAKRALRGFLDVRAYVVRTSLCLRWRGGNGGLNLRSRAPDWREKERVLVVALPGPAEIVLPKGVGQSLPRPKRPPTARQRPGAWLGDILSDLGLL